MHRWIYGVTFEVRLTTSGIRFHAEAHESILDAAIRAGIPLNYGCSNGNCGLCKAKIVSGDTRLLRTHDFVIREAEKLQGHALMCSNACLSDVVIDAEIAQAPADIPVQELRVKVRKIDRISDDLAIITAQVPRSIRLRFLAGQYMQVTDAQQESHNYAIASCPCDAKRLEFHVRKQEGDPFSDTVFNRLSVGAWLDIHGPYGNFVIDESKDNPLVMIAFDTGFAAVKSLLEHVTDQDSERPIYLYWLGCGAEGLYMHNLCRSWADALDQLTYVPIHLQEDIVDDRFEGLLGIEEKLSSVLQHVQHPEDADVFTALPDLITKLVRQLLMQKGFQSHQLHHEPVRGNPDLKCIHVEART